MVRVHRSSVNGHHSWWPFFFVTNMKVNKIDMTTGAIFPKLFQFAVPLILSSVLQLLFNAADIVVVGRFAGDNALAAVGSTSSLINLLVNLFVGLSIGCNVSAASAFGAKKFREVSRTVHTAVALSFIGGIILTVAGLVLSRKILLLMSVPEEVLPLSIEYLRIYFGGITATVIYNFGSALLRGKGDTQRPLYILLAAGFINVFLNLVFVIVFKMNVKGVAWATVISQCFSAFCVLLLLVKEKDEFALHFKYLKIYPQILKRILKIGIPAGVQGIIFSFSNVVIQSTVNSFGAVCVAGNSACQSIESFIYISMNGISQASLTFSSQNMGCKKINRVKKSVAVSLLAVIFVGGLLGILALIFDDALFSIYTKNPQVVEAGKLRLFIICTTYFTCGLMDVMANSIRGMGYSFLPMVVTLIGACGIRLVYLFTVFTFPSVHSFRNIFISYPVSWIVTFLILSVIFMMLLKKETVSLS